MSEHRLILVEKADDRHTPDECLIELTVRHGQCAKCHAPLYLAPEAIVVTKAHVDGSYNLQRYCDETCLFMSLDLRWKEVRDLVLKSESGED